MSLMKTITPTWPAPQNIHAFSTTCEDGFSLAPYDSLNLAAHVGDDLETVKKNRALLKKEQDLPCEPAWLTQTHSTIAVYVEEHYGLTEADASYTREKEEVCAVLTADCLPLLICNKKGTEVAAIHAGWKGLAKGVVENTIRSLQSKPQELLIWLGPAAGSTTYEVGVDVRSAFLNHSEEATSGFTPTREGHYLMDIYHLARQRLQALGVKEEAVYGGDYCTITQSDLFYSYRKRPITGRFASLIWMT